MNDREFKKQKRRVLKLARWWRLRLCLGQWTITHEFEREGLLQDDRGQRYRVLAQTTPAWEYLQATVQWDMGMVAKQGDYELENAVVHELLHMVLAEAAPRGSDEENAHIERVVSLLAVALQGLKRKAA